MRRDLVALILVVWVNTHIAIAGETDFEKGVAAFQSKQYDLAIAFFSAAIKENPSNAHAFNNRGAAQKYKRNFDQAISDFTEAIRLDPTDVSFLTNRGGVYSINGKHDLAINDYKKAIALDPKDSVAYNNLATTYRCKKDYDHAIDSYGKAILIKPSYALSFAGRGFVYGLKRDYKRAAKDFEEAARLDSARAEFSLYLAHLLAVCPDDEVRNGKKALVYAKKACEVDKWNNPDYFVTLACAYAEIGSFDEAIEWITKAMRSEDQLPMETQEKCPSLLKLFELKRPCREDMPLGD